MKTIQGILMVMPSIIFFAIAFIAAILGWNTIAWYGLFAVIFSICFYVQKTSLEPSRERKVYKVSPGKHRSIWRISLHIFKYRMEGYFKPMTPYVLNNNQGQLNKIAGLSWGHHHKMSMRITETYNWKNECWDIYAYWYDKDYNDDGKPRYNKEYMFSMEAKDKRVRFRLGWDKTLHSYFYEDTLGHTWYHKTNHRPMPIGYYLFPNVSKQTINVPWKVEYQFIT